MPGLFQNQNYVNILDILSRNTFLIPAYQRQYSWEEEECSRLWDDFFSFSFPDDDSQSFDGDNDKYFLGTIVDFPNNKMQEVIDGHQRLVTLVLLLRAFYSHLSRKNTKRSYNACQNIEKCIWYVDEADEPDKNSCKIEIKVVTDDTLQEFREILQTGEAPKTLKSRYAENYRLFQKKIDEFSNDDTKDDLPLMPIRIMKNCILLPIVADSQDTALRIFSTLNDRGKPLSDSDIFKAQFYEYYDKQTQSLKDKFVSDWNKLVEVCTKIFPQSAADGIFYRYMYYERAKQGNKSSTIESLRKFYEKNSYALLKKDETFGNIIDLAVFWQDVAEQTERFSDDVLKRLFVLSYAPNDMWANIVSVYYLKNRDNDGILEDEKFCNFLHKITAFILGYSLRGKHSSDFKSPIYPEMLNIINNAEVTFEKYKFHAETLKNTFKSYEFSARKKLTKFMLIWWAFESEKQTLLDLQQNLDFDYIFSKDELRKYGKKGISLFEALGNKYVSIRGKVQKQGQHFLYNGSIMYQDARIKDLYEVPLAKFTKNDIDKRDNYMLQKFIEYLNKNDLIL